MKRPPKHPPEKKPRNLSAEESRLWKFVTRDVSPMGDEGETEPEFPSPKPAIRVYRQKPAAPPPSSKTGKNPAPLLSGRQADMDKNTLTKLLKGDFPIDATLDLHGYRIHEAEREITRFIASHYEKQRRMLLIITGKGTHQRKDETARSLRQFFPEWLNAEGIRPYVLAFSGARPKHGGAGAYYVLLKRKR